jgi:hypothetical protein
MTKDTGNWLSAEQAVLPDGTEREHLPLFNKKLPTLASGQASEASSDTSGADDPAAASAD